MPENGKKYKPSAETLAMIERRKVNEKGVGCQLCTFIVEDLAKNGFITGYPQDSLGAPQFPVEAKLQHIRIEKECSDQEVKI